VGLIALKQEYYPIIHRYVTTDRVKKHFEGIVLGGGGIKSLKNDAQGKTLSAALLRMVIDVEEEIKV
jgi:hypothetical protein